MTFKKMLLVASLALAALAFTAPASASALEWTHDGAPFGDAKSDTLTGQFGFGNPAPGQTKFRCLTHIGLTATGGSTTGTIDSFTPTTETCEGEGLFEGCQLVEDQVTGLPTLVHTEGTNSLTVQNAAIILHTVYDENCPVVSSTWTIADLSLPLADSDLTDVAVSGIAQFHSTFGSPSHTEVTQSTAVFGTMHTETDTLSIK